jgi:hypothetical protein
MTLRSPPSTPLGRRLVAAMEARREAKKAQTQEEERGGGGFLGLGRFATRAGKGLLGTGLSILDTGLAAGEVATGLLARTAQEFANPFGITGVDVPGAPTDEEREELGRIEAFREIPRRELQQTLFTAPVLGRVTPFGIGRTLLDPLNLLGGPAAKIAAGGARSLAVIASRGGRGARAARAGEVGLRGVESANLAVDAATRAAVGAPIKVIKKLVPRPGSIRTGMATRFRGRDVTGIRARLLRAPVIRYGTNVIAPSAIADDVASQILIETAAKVETAQEAISRVVMAAIRQAGRAAARSERPLRLQFDEATQNTIEKTTGLPYNTLFENFEQHASKFSPEVGAYINIRRQATGEVLDNMEAAGMRLPFKRRPTYDPRVVTGAGEIDKQYVNAYGSFNKERQIESAVQAIDEFGIRFMADPDNAIELYLRTGSRIAVETEMGLLLRARAFNPAALVPGELKSAAIRAKQERAIAQRVAAFARGSVRGTPAPPVFRTSRRVPEMPEALARMVAAVQAVKVTGNVGQLRLLRDEADELFRQYDQVFRQEGRKVRKITKSKQDAFRVRDSNDVMIAVRRAPPGTRGVANLLMREEDYNALIRYRSQVPDVLKNFARIAAVPRLFQSTFDFGTQTLQLMPALGQDFSNFARGNPTHIYASSVLETYRTFFNPKRLDERILWHKNHDPEAFQAFLDYDIGLSNDFTQAMTRGGLLSETGRLGRFPIIGSKGRIALAKRFGSGFNAGLDEARLGSWEAMYHITKRQGPKALSELADHIRNSTGTLNSTRLGVSPTQQAIEGAFLAYSPRYTRSAFALAAALTQQNLKGAEARRALGALVAGGTAMYITVAKGLGQEPKLDPTRGDFLTIRIGEQRVGIGGALRSTAQMFGQVLQVATSDPERLVSLDSNGIESNPLLRYFRGRTAPTTSMAWDIFSGEDFLGDTVDRNVPAFLALAAERHVPFGIMAALEATRPEDRPTAFLASNIGLREFPLSDRERRNLVSEDAFQRIDPDKLVQAGLNPGDVGSFEDLTEKVGQRLARGLIADDPEMQEIEAQRLEDSQRTVAEGIDDSDAFFANIRVIMDERQQLELAVDRETLTGVEKRARYDDIDERFRGRFDQNRGQFAPVLERLGTDDNEVNQTIAAWFGIFDETTRSDGGLDHERLDVLRAQLEANTDPDVWEFAMRALEITNRSPERRELQRARLLLQPYFEIRDEIFQRFRAADPNLAPFGSLTELNRFIELTAEEIDPTGQRGAERRIRRRFRSLKRIERLTRRLKTRLRRADPQLSVLLEKWYK